MDSLLPAWPAGGVTSSDLIEAIDRWVGSAAMASLMRAFGAELPTGSLDVKLKSLLRSSEVWDGRRGNERLHATYAELSAETNEVVRETARTLGLAGRDRPEHRTYDHVLVLGGGVITGRARSLFAAALVVAGVRARTVCALGSLRSLSVGFDGSEPPPTEGDAMLAGLREAFPPAGAISRQDGVTPDGHSWWLQRYDSGPLALSVLAAPPTRPGMRANTADTLVGWAERVTRPGPDDRVLLVTTDIYVPFQHIDAIRTLGLSYRCGIETVGLDTTSFPDWPNPPSSVGQTLQELRSALFSMERLYETLQVT